MKIGLADTYGTVFEANADGREISLTLGVGVSGGRGWTTPAVARQIAAGLLDEADTAEACAESDELDDDE